MAQRVAEREQLAAIVADCNRPRKHIEKARIVLASADRKSAQRVAQSIGVSRLKERASTETCLITEVADDRYTWPPDPGEHPLSWLCRRSTTALGATVQIKPAGEATATGTNSGTALAPPLHDGETDAAKGKI